MSAYGTEAVLPYGIEATLPTKIMLPTSRTITINLGVNDQVLAQEQPLVEEIR